MAQREQVDRIFMQRCPQGERPDLPRVGWSVDGFTEEHPAKAVLLGPVGLGIPVPGVVGEVLVMASLV